MRLILTLVIILTSLYIRAGGLDSVSIMFNRTPEREINLHLKGHNLELSTNGFLTAASGLGFITAGALLEKKRIERNVPDGYFGYNKRNDIGFNYFLMTFGSGLTITGVIMIRKAYK
jgi:hypothetical protein